MLLLCLARDRKNKKLPFKSIEFIMSIPQSRRQFMTLIGSKKWTFPNSLRHTRSVLILAFKSRTTSGFFCTIFRETVISGEGGSSLIFQIKVVVADDLGSAHCPEERWQPAKRVTNQIEIAGELLISAQLLNHTAIQLFPVFSVDPFAQIVHWLRRDQ